MSYPAFVNGKPPVISLSEYDDATSTWGSSTCLDFRNNKYVAVVMEHPEQEVAYIDEKDYEVLNRIFRSAHATHAQQQSK